VCRELLELRTSGLRNASLAQVNPWPVRNLLDSSLTNTTRRVNVITLSFGDPTRKCSRTSYASQTMESPIASAVVLPEELLPPASPSNKRRQPSTSDESAKRPRLDDDETTERRNSTTASKPAAPVRRERGRERRLFGAVLGALSQAPSTTAAQKRRSEIDKRQLVKRQQESEESEQRKAERIARRKVQRWKEQRRFEEQSVSDLSILCDPCILTAARCDYDTTTYLIRLVSSKPSPNHIWYVPRCPRDAT
jgi:hypothetical protein